jgi:hypothetical protein
MYLRRSLSRRGIAPLLSWLCITLYSLHGDASLSTYSNQTLTLILDAEIQTVQGSIRLLETKRRLLESLESLSAPQRPLSTHDNSLDSSFSQNRRPTEPFQTSHLHDIQYDKRELMEDIFLERGSHAVPPNTTTAQLVTFHAAAHGPKKKRNHFESVAETRHFIALIDSLGVLRFMDPVTFTTLWVVRTNMRDVTRITISSGSRGRHHILVLGQSNGAVSVFDVHIYENNVLIIGNVQRRRLTDRPVCLVYPVPSSSKFTQTQPLSSPPPSLVQQSAFYSMLGIKQVHHVNDGAKQQIMTSTPSSHGLHMELEWLFTTPHLRPSLLSLQLAVVQTHNDMYVVVAGSSSTITTAMQSPLSSSGHLRAYAKNGTAVLALQTLFPITAMTSLSGGNIVYAVQNELVLLNLFQLHGPHPPHYPAQIHRCRANRFPIVSLVRDTVRASVIYAVTSRGTFVVDSLYMFTSNIRVSIMSCIDICIYASLSIERSTKESIDR